MPRAGGGERDKIVRTRLRQGMGDAEGKDPQDSRKAALKWCAHTGVEVDLLMHWCKSTAAAAAFAMLTTEMPAYDTLSQHEAGTLLPLQSERGKMKEEFRVDRLEWCCVGRQFARRGTHERDQSHLPIRRLCIV